MRIDRSDLADEPDDALAAIIALAMIRVSRQDLSGADPTPEPAGDATAPSQS